MMEPEPLLQIDRTCVRYRGRKLSYFSGCDYFRLATHPRVIAALAQSAKRYGVSVAASRVTTGNHPLYGELEEKFSGFFSAQAALLVSSGYITNMVVAQALAGNVSHALIDESAHASLQDATRFLECPVLHFKHRNADDLLHQVRRCGRGAKIILLTDGLFAHDGSVAPLKDYLEVLPADALMLVDDAHGAGVLGKAGKGSPEHARIDRQRVIQTITLSKALGSHGGVILGAKSLSQSILTRSTFFSGSTPVPLPLASSAITALDLLQRDKRFRQRLFLNSDRVKAAFRRAGLELPQNPGPFIGLVPPNKKAAQGLRRNLLQAGVFPPSIVYPAGTSASYFRFAISSEHTPQQLDRLERAVAKAGLAGWHAMG
jgi:7-keto-8-aminopelargonate synthetase-like enzyme